MQLLSSFISSSKTSSFAKEIIKTALNQLCRESSTFAATAGVEKKCTVERLSLKYRNSEPITAVTAYDFPSAKQVKLMLFFDEFNLSTAQVDAAGIDIVLVGDSASMVVHGHDTTLPITIDEMLTHAKAVKRGTRRSMIVCDLPFGTYEESVNRAVQTALKVVKEGCSDAVKLEGAIQQRLDAIKAIRSAGVPVMGHIGLTPQSVHVFGGFKPQGRSADAALALVQSAVRLEEAGCFAIVVECVPDIVTLAIKHTVNIPIIGIGAGQHADGQILVYHDLLGLTAHPHHASVSPKFCKQYAQLGRDAASALKAFKQEVEDKIFPSKQFSPYAMKDTELQSFAEGLNKLGFEKASLNMRHYLLRR